MKKAMKLVWMVLVALPMIAITSCSDDDKDELITDDGVEVKFEDYSKLLNKTLSDILDKEMKDFNPDVYSDGSGVFYNSEDDNDLGINVNSVMVDFWFYDEDENGDEIVLYKSQKSLMVMEEVYGFKQNDMYNFLTDKYGKPEMLSDGTYEYSKDNMYIWFEYINTNDISIYYINKNEYDKYYRTKANTKDGAYMRKAMKARR